MKRMQFLLDSVRALPGTLAKLLVEFLEYEEKQFSPNCPECGQEGDVMTGAELVCPSHITRVCPNGHMYHQRISVGIGASAI